jgi:putative transposase
MPWSRFTEEKIVKSRQESEAGAKTDELCRRHRISWNTFYVWRKKYGGMELSDVKRLKELEEENRRLKKAMADLTLDKIVPFGYPVSGHGPLEPVDLLDLMLVEGHQES